MRSSGDERKCWSHYLRPSFLERRLSDERQVLSLLLHHRYLTFPQLPWPFDGYPSAGEYYPRGVPPGRGSSCVLEKEWKRLLTSSTGLKVLQPQTSNQSTQKAWATSSSATRTSNVRSGNGKARDLSSNLWDHILYFALKFKKWSDDKSNV